MQENISKRYTLESVAETLRSAREAKGWSQRELGARSGLAQGQISRIENGGVDMQLTTLIELARTLDLDLQLVPRSALPAVAAAVRDIADRVAERDLGRALSQLGKAADRLTETYPDATRVAALKDSIRELAAVSPLLNGPAAAGALQKPANLIEALLHRQRLTPAQLNRDISLALERLRDIRNVAVHGDGLRQIRAYDLDEED